MVLSTEIFNQSVCTEYSEAVNERYMFQPLWVSGKRCRRNVTIFCENSNCATTSIKKSKKVMFATSSELSEEKTLEKEFALSLLSKDHCLEPFNYTDEGEDNFLSVKVASTSTIRFIRVSATIVFMVLVSHNSTGFPLGSV